MKLALNLILVCSLSLLVVGKKRNGNMKGGLQMTNVAVSGNDMCGTNNKCNADQTHVVCMRIDGEFWTTTEQSAGIDPSLNEPHYHCICVGALTFYLDKKGGSADCEKFQCDGMNYEDTFLSDNYETDTIWMGRNETTKQARDAVNNCCNNPI